MTPRFGLFIFASTLAVLALLERTAAARDCVPQSVVVVADFSKVASEEREQLERGVECAPQQWADHPLVWADEGLSRRFTRCRSDEDCLTSVLRSVGATAALKLQAIPRKSGGVDLESTLTRGSEKTESPVYRHHVEALPTTCKGVGAELSSAILPHSAFVPRLPLIIASGSSRDSAIHLYRRNGSVLVTVAETVTPGRTLQFRPSCIGSYTLVRESPSGNNAEAKFEVTDDGSEELFFPAATNECPLPNRVALATVGGAANPHIVRWLLQEVEDSLNTSFTDLDTAVLGASASTAAAAEAAEHADVRGLLVISIGKITPDELEVELGFRAIPHANNSVTHLRTLQIPTSALYGVLPGRADIIESLIPSTNVSFKGVAGQLRIDRHPVTGNQVALEPGCHQAQVDDWTGSFSLAFEEDLVIDIPPAILAVEPDSQAHVARPKPDRTFGDKRLALIAAGAGAGTLAGPLGFFIVVGMGGLSVEDSAISIGAALAIAICNPLAIGVLSASLPGEVIAEAVLIDVGVLVTAMAPALWYVAEVDSRAYWVPPVAAVIGSVTGMALGIVVGAVVWPAVGWSPKKTTQVEVLPWATPESAGVFASGNF
ncbi:MAG: hypothetical protein U0271_06790 [Polyangiaceae bacterium]